MNRRDAQALLACSDPEIEISGPRGPAHGHQILLAWLERAGLRLEPGQLYARDKRLVVEFQAEWLDPEGRSQGKAELALAFEVAAGRVTRCLRFERSQQALQALGLSEADRAPSLS